MIGKKQILKAIEKMPDDATIEHILYRLYVFNEEEVNAKDIPRFVKKMIMKSHYCWMMLKNITLNM